MDLQNKQPILKEEYQIVPQENRYFDVVELGRAYLRSEIKKALLKKHNINELSDEDLHKSIHEIKKYIFRESHHMYASHSIVDDFIAKILSIREEGYFLSKFEILHHVNRNQFQLYTPDSTFLCVATQRNEIKISIPSLIPMFKDKMEKAEYENDWEKYLLKNEKNYKNIQSNYRCEFETENNHLTVQVFPIW